MSLLKRVHTYTWHERVYGK